MKKTEHYKGHRWTNDELRALMALWAAEKTLDEISAELNVTTFAVLKMVQKLRKNGVPLARRRRGNSSDRANKSWTQGEVEYLIRRRTEKATADEIATELGRTATAVNAMIQNVRREGVPVAMLGSGVRRLWNPEALKVVAIQAPESNIIEMEMTAKRVVNNTP